MDDKQIVELYWARSDQAIAETDAKYGGYCRAIARRILRNEEDSEECVSDTWLRAWDAIPPRRPEKLAPFLGRITRNLSLDRWKRLHTEKRGGGETALALEELSGCVPAVDPTARIADRMALAAALDKFLAELSAENRVIFMRRYWYLWPVKEIARDLGMKESRVKMSLLRARNKLREILEKEGFPCEQ